MIRKKIIIIITTIILTATFSIKNVSAVDFNMSFYNPNPCTTCTYEAQPNEIEPYRQDYNQYHCEYFDNLYRTRKISLNAYDEQGRTIIPYSKLSLVKFKSGTWMGINVREKKLSSWDI